MNSTKRWLIIPVVLLSVVGIRAGQNQAPGNAATEAPVPVDREPRHHVVHADDRLRVLEVRIPGHDTTLHHRHDHDLVTVNLENGPTRTWSSPGGWSTVRARDVGGVNVTEYTTEPSSHIVQTTEGTPYRLTGVENLRAGGWTRLGPIDGKDLVVIAESRAFRAYQLQLSQAVTAAHTHAVPVVVILVDGTATAGSAGPVTLTVPGQWGVVQAGRAHTIEAGGAGAKIIEIEVR